MTTQKFETELQTLQKFFPLYCDHKHTNLYEKYYTVEYKKEIFSFHTNLCHECHTLLEYSLQRLQECPHEIKPRCRKCLNPCYGQKEWKNLAKLMRYSAVQIGLDKIKKFIFNTKETDANITKT